MRSLTGGREMRAMRSQSIHSTTRPGRQQAPEVDMDARLRLENERLKQACGAWTDFCHLRHFDVHCRICAQLPLSLSPSPSLPPSLSLSLCLSLP